MQGATSRATRRKLVVVGDGACGKTSLLIAFAHDEFPETHIPTVFETYLTEIKVGICNILLTDRALLLQNRWSLGLPCLDQRRDVDQLFCYVNQVWP